MVEAYRAIISDGDSYMISRYERLSAVVAEISRLISKTSACVMGEFGLRGSWARYLLAMRKTNAPVTAARLCELCGRDKADTSRFIAELGARGLVERVSRGNYRARIKLTEEGERIADAINERALTIISYVSGDITDGAREVLYSSLDSIAENLKRLNDEGYEAI